MNIIKLLFFVVILFLMSKNVFAQDEFYNESSKENNTSINFNTDTSSDSNNIDEYKTERDYVNNSIENNDEVIPDEEVAFEEQRRKQQRRNRAEFAAEIFFDVIVNAAFIVVTF